MIAILLSTYNGEKFVGEQIESIIYQNNKDLLLTAILNLYFILNNKKGQKI